MIIVKCNKIKKYFPIKRGYLKETAGFAKAVDISNDKDYYEM